MTETPEKLPERLAQKDAALNEVFNKNHELFDKQIVYVATGALGLSLAFIDKVTKDIFSAHYKWMLLLGWGLLIIALLVFVGGYLIAASFAEKTIREVRELAYDEDIERDRHNFIKVYNRIIFLVVVIGIGFIVSFAAINIMSKPLPPQCIH